jgi:hypothetical protein
MSSRIGRVGDLLYAGMFGALVGLAVWGLADLLAEANGAEGFALAGWNVFGFTVGLCAAIATARAIRWHRSR